MQILSLPRGMGKTTNAVDYVSRNDHTILLVPTTYQKREILQKRPDLQTRVFTVAEYQSFSTFGLRYSSIVIDEPSGVLRALGIQHKIDFATLTPGD